MERTDASLGPSASDAPTRSERVELGAAVFATGFGAIVIEILGTRVIGPAFGVSLFVWSALLTVTLTSLAAGYYAGGAWVDRAPSFRLLGIGVLTGGVLLGVVPLLRAAVLRACEALGPRGGPLVAAALLFAPCLGALGMTGPIAVRLATRDLRTTGRRVGAIYALSTVGSVAGAIVTGFVLVPAFDTDDITFGAALGLVLLGGFVCARHGRSAALLSLLVPVAVRVVRSEAPLPSGLAVVARSQSLYGLVEVVDDERRGVRMMRADHSVIGAQFSRDGSSAFGFIYVLEAVRFLRPAARDVLQIGLGTGALPALLEPRGLRVDVVEVDPAVVRLARRYFGFSPNGDVYVGDARSLLQRTEKRYDIIVHDTFTGGTTPEHLLSLEVFRRIRALLRPGGVLALNFVGHAQGPSAEGAWAVARTLRAVFSDVRVFRDRPPGEEPRSASNLIFFACDGDLSFTFPADASFEDARAERYLRAFPAWEVLARTPAGPVVTDAMNPLARLELPVAEEHFRAMNALLPVEYWSR